MVSADQASGEAALKFIEGLMAEPEVDKVYKGVVKTVVDFGAFVEYLPGKDGLLHISELEHFRVGNVEDVVQVGDEIEVKLVEAPQPGAPYGIKGVGEIGLVPTAGAVAGAEATC